MTLHVRCVRYDDIIFTLYYTVTISSDTCQLHTDYIILSDLWTFTQIAKVRRSLASKYAFTSYCLKWRQKSINEYFLEAPPTPPSSHMLRMHSSFLRVNGDYFENIIVPKK